MTAIVSLTPNDMVRIRVMPTGMKMIEVERENLSKRVRSIDWSTWRKPDEGGWLELQLWEVMNFFGPACYNGGELAFERMDVVVIK